MTLNCVKLGRAVTFTKYRASVVSLIFLTKTLIWNKIAFAASNSLKLAELMVNEPIKKIWKKIYQYSFFYLIYHCLMQRFQELITKEQDNFLENPHQYSLWFIMNNQSSNFMGERSWIEGVRVSRLLTYNSYKKPKK